MTTLSNLEFNDTFIKTFNINKTKKTDFKRKKGSFVIVLSEKI